MEPPSDSCLKLSTWLTAKVSIYSSYILQPKKIATFVHEIANVPSLRCSLSLSFVSSLAPTSTSFGHLIFHQSSQSLLSRRDDIRPGDVLTLSDASFKGKKGLQSYASEVGQAVGIVVEFEGKKSKVRVVQAAGKANHYPTLESVR